MKQNTIVRQCALWVGLASLLACGDGHAPAPKLFALVPAEASGVQFANNLTYTEAYNPYTYRNFYNGGGVALGDINNDGLLDIYFSGNLVPNKLYLNKGNMVFEDITDRAGVACADVWSSGVNMVDVNGDGWLDIYVCKAGMPGGDNRHNELFINQGDMTFVEQAQEYGLDVTGLSIQAAFFDFDRDGDLDCYLLNNSMRSVGGFDMKTGLRDEYDPEGNKFFENRDGKFVDITQQAGIYSSAIGYGLGITLADFNRDGWPDIFLSNDFFEKDYLYFNNQNGTFTEASDAAFTSLSMGSMGADACDLDNDGLSEIFVTEMLPYAPDRKKTKTTYETWDKYQLAVSKGYHHQFARNVLHKNMDGRQFVELGRMAGVESSDWSWSALLQDFDNDGLRDIFISNGTKSDLLDKDYLNYMANETRVRAMIDADEEVLKKLIDIMPSGPVANAIYKNEGQLQFSYQSDAWGLDAATFSNGSAYGDLDNDGDLDLVINNVDAVASIYRNAADATTARSVTVALQYGDKNTQAIGAQVRLVADTLHSVYEYYPAKGFQSCSAVPMVFGVGARQVVDSVVVVWPNGDVTVRTQVPTNEVLRIRHADGAQAASGMAAPTVSPAAWRPVDALRDAVHQEIGLNHFDRERLLLTMPGRKGPAVAVADLNGDGRDDVFVGGGKNQASALYLSDGVGGYRPPSPLADTKASEATAAAFFDSDGDGDLDLYVAHGGKAFSIYAPELHDALYVNDGKGNFAWAKGALDFPYPVSTGAVAIADLDKDGKPDVIIGEAMKTNLYGLPGNVLVFKNKGNNQFAHQPSELCEELGMITALTTADVNGDGWEDIVLAGEYMPITVLLSDKGAFGKATQKTTLPQTEGLWNCIEKADLDGDGDMDFVLGNIGQNHFFREGLTTYVGDFDENGNMEQVSTRVADGQHYPIHDIDELYMQMPILKKKYRTYKEFAQAPWEVLVPEGLRQAALLLQLAESRSVVLWNNGGELTPVPLPRQAQYSSVNAVAITDVDADGTPDLLLGGNDYKCKPQFGRQDASFGWVCRGENRAGNVTFAACQPLGIAGQVRALELLDNNKIIVGINDGKIGVYERD